LEEISIAGAVEVALQNNPDIQSRRKEVDAAAARVLQAGRIANPEIGVSWNETPQIFSLSAAGERDIHFSQSIEFPTKRGGRLEVAATDREIALLRLERASIILAAQVRRAYFSLLLSRETVEMLESQRDHLEDLQKILSARYQTSSSSYLDVVRANVELARLGNDLIEARRTQLTRQRELNLLLGREGDRGVVLTDSFPLIRSQTNADSLADALVERSLALRIGETTITRQEQSLSAARTSFLPDFHVGLANQRRGAVSDLWGIELTATLPLWFWQEPAGLVDEGRALLDIATLLRQSVDRQVRAAVRDAVESVEAAAIQLETFDRSLLADADDIVSTAVNLYQNNQIDILNLLDVYRTYRLTQLEHLRALHHYAVALADLEAAPELPFENLFSAGDQQ
jgi:outer membrane protein TolC